jgi:hypothetical protein
MPSSSLTPEQRSLRARMGAYAMHARHDVRETTRAGSEALLARFLDEVDPQRVLAEAERERRASAALKAHMLKLAWRAAEVHRRKAAGGDAP